MEDRDDPLMLMLIAAAVEAGANRRAARILPGAARSLNGLADDASRQVRALAAEVMKGAAPRGSDDAAPFPHPRGGATGGR